MKAFLLTGVVAMVPFAAATPLAAQAPSAVAGAAAPAAADGAAGEIVVTAQKRTQSINDVGLSISVASGDQLIRQGVTNTSDLARIVPGLTAQPSPFNTPVYTLRGVGFYDSTLSAPPTVAVYVDEVPLPYSAMTRAAGLDVERVEVLKGPQGTLFGNNTTGGAINYIAAKPTNTLKAGVDSSYDNFGKADLQGFLSGPISDNVRARLSLRTVQGGDWQYNIGHTAELGSSNLFQGRLLVDADVTDRFSLKFALSGWQDKSDTQAAQRIDTYISVPSSPQAAANLAYPYPAHNDRAADWGTDLPLHRNDYHLAGSIRGDYALSDNVNLTSITAVQRYKTRALTDFDGTERQIIDALSRGHIDSISQEVRLSGKGPGLTWLVGANYESDHTYDAVANYFGDSTTSQVGPLHMTLVDTYSRQNVRSVGLFANAEKEIVDHLSVIAGIRYNDTRRRFAGCSVNAPGGGVGAVFEFLQTAFRGAATPIPDGGCVTLSPTYNTYPDAIRATLAENNVSWKIGVNYKTANRGLIYATVNKGYKAGSFPTTAASASVQYAPVKQESVLAYEVGFKQPLFDRRLQLNAAAFYYDYRDKQLRGRLLDPVFGPLDALVQIPKSRIYGAEAEAIVRPLTGLHFSVAGTYLNSRINRFTGYNNAGVIQNFAGTPFPYSPKWQTVGDAEYEMPVSDRLKAFLGGSFTYNSSTTASIGDTPQLAIRAYTLVDLRGGVESSDGRWRLSMFGRNIFNKYYWVNALQTNDVYVRFTGRPATWGGSLSFRL